jgi:hypothetical protein
MSRFRWGVTVALGVAALAIPAGAIASKGDNHGHHNANGHGPHNVAYVFKGFYAGEGSAEGEGSVEVKHGNARVRKGGFIGQTVAFDLSHARLVVADTNNDGTTDLNDVQVGDKILVKAMLPKNDPGSQPFAAKLVVDQTHPPTE